MTIGIIGRNGSGKSTLLQIICSVLQPTSGTVTVNGRISALLELGAGFDPEFTGLQNVLMNGRVSGFSRAEMDKRIPLIEAFADIGEFFHQPVKIYSSGMFVRLAFAAAINVDPDILIVDEALAVGDPKFQYKCYNKFKEFQKSGKTILFVSHDTDAIVKHCDFAVLLEDGVVIKSGVPKDVTNCYLDILFSGNLHEYALNPVLIETDYNGFNIIHFGKKYYAFLQSLGHIDLINITDKVLDQYQDEKSCITGTSPDETKFSIDKHLSSDNGSNSNLITRDVNKNTIELENFINDRLVVDNCLNRKSYNKNEYRYGNKKAEIIDYLITIKNDSDIVKIDTGEEVNIYVKIKYNEEIEEFMTGFAINTIDGVGIYGTSSKNMNMVLGSKLKDDHQASYDIFKWTLTLNLAQGDYFIDVGCAEYINNESLPLDRRYGLAHLAVHSDTIHAGFYNLETKFEAIY